SCPRTDRATTFAGRACGFLSPLFGPTGRIRRRLPILSSCLYSSGKRTLHLGGIMFRTHARDARRRPLLIALTLALALGALAATAAPASAASVDTLALLNVCVHLEANGGVYFDPANTGQTGNPTGRIWQDLIYDTMIHNTPDGEGAPRLAHKWTTPAPSTVELTLRDGVKFSDGTPFNAAAVKGAWDRTLAAPRPNVTPAIQAVASIEAVNDNTIRIHLKQPIAKQFIDSELKSTVSLAVPSPASIAA